MKYGFRNHARQAAGRYALQDRTIRFNFATLRDKVVPVV
jgi:hypothetical protein